MGAHWVCLPREAFLVIFHLYESYIPARHEMSSQAFMPGYTRHVIRTMLPPSAARLESVRSYSDLIHALDLRPQKIFQADVNKH